MLTFEILLLFAVAWTLMFIRPRPVIWCLFTALTLVVATLYFTMSGIAIGLLWVLFGFAAGFALSPTWRQFIFSKPFLKRFRKILLPMSNTEREALEAGDVWWEGDLFAGRPNWRKLLAIPKPELTDDEQAFIKNQVTTLCSLLDDWKIVQEDCDLTQQTWDYLKKEGFFGLVIDQKYGGRGFSALAHSTIVTIIASRSMSAAVDTMVPNSLGPGELLQHYGTEAQKDYYLPRLARGEEVPCFALTSLEGGSDAGAMRDFGTVCKGQYEGKEIIGIKVTWNKRYITLAPIATVLGLAFKLFDPEHLLGDKDDIGITLALLPTSHPGVNIGKRHYPLNQAFMNGPTEGKEVFIPLDWIIGGPAMAGKGWRMLMECLSIGRAISLPALGAATGRLSYHTTGIYARLRQQFKISIGQFEGVQEALAKIAGFTYILEASTRMTAASVDLGVKPSVVSAIQKYHSTEWGRIVLDAAMDVHAGRAVQSGPRNYLANAYFGTPVAITVEGANILTRDLIIFGQGAVRCHPYVIREMEAVGDADPKRGLHKFDNALKSHIGYTISNLVRTISFGLTNACLVHTPHHAHFRSYYKQLTRMSSALALTSDFAMLVLGGALKRKERLSARLGDVLSYLYFASTLLKYHADEGYPEEDLSYMQWGLQYCLWQIQTGFEEFFANFAPRGLAKVLQWCIFPYGRAYRRPSDHLEQKIVEVMFKPSNLRTRLTDKVYRPNDANDSIGRMDDAFNKVLAAEAIILRVNQAGVVRLNSNSVDYEVQISTAIVRNAISAAEAATLRAARTAARDAMEVDAFDADYLVNRMNKK
jgi:alkylation response protein AidB-like acyl-CoA dehydrogenase